jgi:lycopene beta-cyclase
MAAALFHAITGYSFPNAVRTADLVASLPDFRAATIDRALRAHAEATWAAQGYYRLLNKMLFRAAEPSARWRILDRFYKLDAALVGRFYAGQSSAYDKLRILAGKPPVPVGRAVAALLNKRPRNRGG